ncbi:hypothetical protein [Micromonospora polyrhachis]|uniref:Uncharacterized protein n=1 Tax=Micromonospora polyrhachis TaxID=1282883 RepID=A0A7W7WP10_9ACTN|nr:hypothetical protein [Micromonospora polyrhachis]MBB4957753.1 hypothetical protein [Micromonospora polyrhachis]
MAHQVASGTVNIVLSLRPVTVHNIPADADVRQHQIREEHDITPEG